MDQGRLYENAAMLFDMTESVQIIEGGADDGQSEQVRQMMLEPSNWIRNDYDDFIDSLNKSKRSGFLSHYTPQELEKEGIQTYRLKGYSIGFALHTMPDGNVDIISVHNNEPNIHNIADTMLSVAKHNGGTQLDHFEGKLSDIYGRNGFEEYERYKWDDQYAPADWDYETYGRPDVVLRRIKSDKVREWCNRQKRLTERMERL